MSATPKALQAWLDRPVKSREHVVRCIRRLAREMRVFRPGERAEFSETVHCAALLLEHTPLPEGLGPMPTPKSAIDRLLDDDAYPL